VTARVLSLAWLEEREGRRREIRRYVRLFARSASSMAGLAIYLTVLGFNLLGDGLRDLLDPKSLSS